MIVTNKVALAESSGKLVIKQIPAPIINDGSIIIKNHFAGVNFADNAQVAGKFNATGSNILGFEGVGEVIELGKDISQFKVGDRVIYAAGSTYAEYTKIESSKFSVVTKLPDDILYETVAGLGAQALVAYTLAYKEYNVQKNDYLLVHAAAGGVGIILVQLLSNLGAKVIAAVGSDEKVTIAKKFGAQYGINYTKEDIVERVKEITNGEGVHAVYDSVGKIVVKASLEALRPFGTYINFGHASGTAQVEMTQVVLGKCLRIHGSVVTSYQKEGDAINEWWYKLFDMVRSGVLRVHVSKIYTLDQTHEALADIKSRKTTGKLLVKI